MKIIDRRAPILIVTLLTATLFACTKDNAAPSTTTLAAPETDSVDSGNTKAAAQIATGFSSERFANNIQTLSSDEFEGRQPASAGETKTINFLRDEFSSLGLQPGNGDSFFQAVPLVEITADPDMTLTVKASDQVFKLAYGDDMMAWTTRVTEHSAILNSDMVFVGYGIVAPDYEWNDYSGIDVKGKTVVILINDPGFATQDPALFNGKAMTYYGRWTYKYEEAARQGAAGAIIVHDEAPAAYPWEVVSGSWSGPQFDLVSANKNADRAAVEGWVTLDVAKQLFAAAGLEWEQSKRDALKNDFKAQAMNMQASLAIKNTLRESTSNNVIAVLPGSKRPDETIIYTAHWDHLGKKEGEGDQIFNGALDNATGTAGLIELANAFAALPEKPERSIVLLAVTAEEAGLLGSRYYAENPVYSLANTVATINMDGMNILGKTRDITVVGQGSSELEDYLDVAAKKQNRTPKPEPTPEKGYYYRSDHFNFAKQGVPSLYAEGGVDYIDRPEGWGLAQQQDYTTHRYHKPGDEYDDSWDLSGAIDDLGIYFEIGERLANSSDFPAWREGNEFRQIRERSRSER